MPTVYKIRNRKTGLYSKGGMSPRFHATGKTWNNRGALSNHLNLIRGKVYGDCEVVSIEVTHTEVATTPVADYLKAKAEKRAETEARRRQEEADATEQRERALLASLMAKYPDQGT